MKVCMVAPVHRFDDVRVFQKEAVTLVRLGHEVHLHARGVAYGGGVLEEPARIRGVLVNPVPSRTSRLRRFAELPRILRVIVGENCDVYHLHNPDTLPLAVILKLMGRKVVYDTHEDFSQRILLRAWIPSFLRPFIARLVVGGESLVAKVADAVIVTQSTLLQRLGDRAVLIENAPVLQEDGLDDVGSSETGVFRIVYVGSISRERGVFELLDALVAVNRATACRMWLIGPIQGGIDEEIHDRPGWDFVDYKGELPQSEAFDYIRRAQLGVATILDAGDHAATSPNKLFEYLSLSTPFLASNFEVWRRKLHEAQAGWFVEPNADAISDQLGWCARNRQECRAAGLRGRGFIEKQFNWELESRKLAAIYSRLGEGRKERAAKENGSRRSG